VRATTLAANLRFLRPALIVLLAVDVIALGAFAVRVESVTRTVTTPPVVSAQPPAPLVPVATTPKAVPVVTSVPLGTDASRGDVDTAVPAATKPTPTPTPAPGTPTDPGTDEPTRVARCPIGIKEPTTSGGLQTLIAYAPAFGPFRDEAFAAASAYQPLLQLLGPILAKYPEIAPEVEPALTPFLSAFAGLLDQGYTLIAPLYAPYREGFLAAESKLAAALAPYAQKLATSPLGGCVVALQAALVEDTA
jgi:hypothetical protein